MNTNRIRFLAVSAAHLALADDILQQPELLELEARQQARTDREERARRIGKAAPSPYAGQTNRRSDAARRAQRRFAAQ